MLTMRISEVTALSRARKRLKSGYGPVLSKLGRIWCADNQMGHSPHHVGRCETEGDPNLWGVIMLRHGASHPGIHCEYVPILPFCGGLIVLQFHGLL